MRRERCPGAGAALGAPQEPARAGATDPAALCHRPKFKQKAEEEEEGQEVENPLLVPLEEKSVLEERRTSLWFGKVSPTCEAGMMEQPWPQQLPRTVLG